MGGISNLRHLWLSSEFTLVSLKEEVVSLQREKLLRYGDFDMRFQILIAAAATTISVRSGPAVAQQQSFEWINPAGGQFEDPANWPTQSVPSNFDVAVFDLASPPLEILAFALDVRDLLIGMNEVTVMSAEAAREDILEATRLLKLSREQGSDGRLQGRLRRQLDAIEPV